MSPRPKRAPDADLIQTAARVVAERGAAQTRLSDVAAASGFAAATLVQRFGTRERLLQAVGESQVASIRQEFTTSAPSHLERLSRALHQLHLAGHLAFLHAYPETAAPYSLELRRWIGHTLAAAVDGGELPHCDVAAHGRRVQLAYFGLATAAFLERNPLAPADFSRLVEEVLADFM